jgi:hypothetical protein
MKRIILLMFSLLLFVGCSSDSSQIDIEVPQKVENRITFYEEYVHVIKNNKEEPIFVETFNEEESDIFIEEARKAGIVPENILKAGNELYFIARVNKKDVGNGQAVFIYDVLDHKFGELYFYKKGEYNLDVDLVLQAIDAGGNALVLVLEKEELDCDSLWLSQSDNFYTFDLLNNRKEGLVRYKIPEWKIEEESNKFPDCVK